MTVEPFVPRPRTSPEDAGRSSAPPSGAVAELHALVVELELTTRAVRTLAAVAAAIDAATARGRGDRDRHL